jgi:hypothetical protein
MLWNDGSYVEKCDMAHGMVLGSERKCGRGTDAGYPRQVCCWREGGRNGGGGGGFLQPSENTLQDL